MNNNIKKYKIAMMGPENSGKSSIVNKIFGKSISEVSEVGGTTKKPVRKYWGKLKIGRLKQNPEFADITFADLGGLYSGEDKSVVMVGNVLEKTFEEIDSSDMIIHVIDAKDGLFKSFEKLHHLLKYRYQKPIIVIVNKCDLLSSSERNSLTIAIEERLNNKVYFTSAMSYEGINELINVIITILKR
ncbi:small GTP-binding protein [Methanococcus voltae]|uniref:Era-like GTP-binding protein n=1 Tax=Methanococcus voltae TaxID=2188 RepID=UPI001AEB361B|nr:Era-like GTP-binding protein [Methanococcus voltae]MBP2143217.1 small GTP-binding protein [Methanococcus voltae]